jgi:lipoprotein-releasing system permease protein
MIFNPSYAPYLSQNLIYLQYASIPAKVNFIEVFYITMFGVISAVVSSWIASRKIMQFQVSEVLRDE